VQVDLGDQNYPGQSGRVEVVGVVVDILDCIGVVEVEVVKAAVVVLVVVVVVVVVSHGK